MEVLPSDKREQRPDERKSPHEYNTNKFYDVSGIYTRLPIYKQYITAKKVGGKLHMKLKIL